MPNIKIVSRATLKQHSVGKSNLIHELCAFGLGYEGGGTGDGNNCCSGPVSAQGVIDAGLWSKFSEVY